MNARESQDVLAVSRVASWWPIAAAALAVVAMHFIQEFNAPPNMGFPLNGTPWVPHSDALGPWLHGGLAYFFGVTPPGYLYRPSVGLFWGSILAAGGRIELIPFFFSLWLGLACATVAMFASDRALRGAVVIALCYFAMRFPQTWHWVGFDIDLAALALTCSGVLLVFWDRGKSSRAALIAGCACLGVAAAIRGPMMFAGPIVLGVRLILLESPSRKAMVPVLVFLSPIIADMLFQARLDIANNGWLGMYCVYADPSHAFTPRCSAAYRKLLPSNAEVMQGFLAFRASIEGMSLLWSQLAWRAQRDLLWIHSPATYAVLLAIPALASRYSLRRSSDATPFVRAALVVATLIAVACSPGWVLGPLAWLFLAILASALVRNWRAFACLAGYVAGAMFLGMIGLLTFDRFVHTFAFMLVLGIGLLVMEGRRESDGAALSFSDGAQSSLAAATGLLLVFLYAGSFVPGGQMRDTYLREVFGRQDRAIKVSDEARVDRSLYYLGGGHVMYTRHDSLPIGAVRKYRAVANSNIGNDSLIVPNAFID